MLIYQRQRSIKIIISNDTMRVSAVIVALTAIGLTYAHTTVDRFFVNNVAQGVGKCLRLNKDGGTRTNPVENLAAKEMACGGLHPSSPHRRSFSQHA